MATPYDHHGCNYPTGYNLAKHPTCDAVRRERRRLLQLQSQHLNLISPPQHDARYYLSCYFAGGLSSSIRWVLSPLELIKTRLQTSSSVATTIISSNYGSSTAILAPTIKNNTMVGTFVNIYAQEGATGLFRGVGPTAVAYWLQTSTKYSLYELIKDKLSTTTSSKDEGTALNRSLVYVTAAASAEAIADIFMCPFEMLKVKMQTNITGSSSTLSRSTSTSFPQKFLPALKEMIVNRKKYNFPFGSLAPVWGRQIPGTIINFFTFENAVSMIYASMGDYSKSDYTPTQQLSVTVLAGYIAGICCAVVSHPADSIISLKSLPEHHGHSIVQIVRSVGWYRLATKGLLPRIMMTGQIIAFQWLLYDSFKSMLGYSTSGGSK